MAILEVGYRQSGTGIRAKGNLIKASLLDGGKFTLEKQYEQTNFLHDQSRMSMKKIITLKNITWFFRRFASTRENVRKLLDQSREFIRAKSWMQNSRGCDINAKLFGIGCD